MTRGAYRLSIERNPAIDVPRDGAASAADGARGRTASIVLLTELSTRGDVAGLPAAVPRMMTGSLIGANGIVATGPVLRRGLATPVCDSDIVRRSAADFVLDGEIQSVRDGAARGSRTIETVMRLFSVRTGAHAWSISCTESVLEHDLPDAAEIIAARLVVLLEQAFATSAPAP